MQNRLEHLAEFQEVLSNYHISDASKKILAGTKLALMVAPSAGGRNTIIRELLKTGGYHYIVSDTTRHPRVNDGVPEQDGEEYWFRSEAEVLADLRAGTFLEAALIHNQQVSGISIRELKAARDEQKIALADIEIVGMENIIAAKPDSFAIFVLPPSFEAWMRRLDSRGAMHAEEKRRRLESALQEFEAASQQTYYQFVINDTVAHALSQIQAITQGRQDTDAQAKAQEINRQLLEATRKYLA